MLLYVDGSTAQYGGKSFSPAIVYQHQNDFSRILDEIAAGNIPCCTGVPFDVTFDLNQDGLNPPWETPANIFTAR